GEGRLALQRRRVVQEFRLRLPQAVLSHHRATYTASGGAGERAAPRITAQGGLLYAPVRRRARAIELPDDESAGAARDARHRRREPGARDEQPAARSRARWRTAARLDDRRDRLPARPQRRDEPRQGDLPERPDAAHSVAADHERGVTAYARHHPALDQPRLHTRPAREELLH